MQFPLSLTFKVVALAPQISVMDANDNELCYVRQKLFKLRENISVFRDASKSQLISQIQADRIIDFSASYSFIDGEGNTYGSVKRRGFRSIWRTRYEIYEGTQSYTIQEGNPWVKILDGLVGEIPILGAFTGYFLNPHYDVIDTSGQTCYKLTKKPSFFGRRFILEKLTQSDEDDLLIVMSIIMMTLLERRRG
ncbi:MAG: hypothetical protein KC422_10240 [Trueperaceae bacterium]|nr:hypothetical protein [Trueperaceae bacterium]